MRTSSWPAATATLKASQSETNFERICVIGLGYIGLPTAAVFASRGLEVIGVDVNPRVVAAVSDGHAPVVEPDLEQMVRSVTAAGLLQARGEPQAADVFIIAVGTPCREGMVPDTSYIQSAAESLAPALRPGNLVILESTSPVGTTEQLAERLAESRADLTFPQQAGEDADVQIAYCPERVLPGRMLTELVQNDRIIGGMTPRCSRRASAVYQVFVQGECVRTDVRTAELAKLAENSFRDVNIAFANELSLICEKLGIDVWELISVANRHPRVQILRPGPGVGGHCIAVDPWFIVHSAPEQARLIRTARQVNDSKPEHVLAKVKEAAATYDEPVIACLGLAFKPDIDDLRESPAVEIVAKLAGSGIGPVLAVEPHINELPDELAELFVGLVGTAEALSQANVVVLLVDHTVFADIGPQELQGKTVIDTRGLWRATLNQSARLRLVA